MSRITARGGEGICCSGPHGGAGTIFLKTGTQAHGDLIIDNAALTVAAGSTPLRAIGPGISTAMEATVVTNTVASFALPDSTTGTLGLIGLELNPSISQAQTFTVIGNTATTLLIDPAAGDVTLVASPGDPYIGVYTFDNLIVINGASMTTADVCVMIGTLDTTGGTTTCNNLP